MLKSASVSLCAHNHPASESYAVQPCPTMEYSILPKKLKRKCPTETIVKETRDASNAASKLKETEFVDPASFLKDIMS